MNVLADLEVERVALEEDVPDVRQHHVLVSIAGGGQEAVETEVARDIRNRDRGGKPSSRGEAVSRKTPDGADQRRVDRSDPGRARASQRRVVAMKDAALSLEAK